jgi:hypothetical protein
MQKKAMSHAVSAVPCVLNLHKRVLEKVIEMIFTETLNLHGGQTIAGRKRRVKYMEEYINTIAFGTAERPGEYTIPLKNKTIEVGRSSSMMLGQKDGIGIDETFAQVFQQSRIKDLAMGSLFEEDGICAKEVEAAMGFYRHRNYPPPKITRLVVPPVD